MMLATFVMIDGNSLDSVVIYHCTGKLGLDGGGIRWGRGEGCVFVCSFSCNVIVERKERDRH